MQAKRQTQEPPLAALLDLYRRLEDHAPQWYTYEHHRKSEVGLQREGQEQAEAFLMLCNLLEEYAPQWYSKEPSRPSNIWKMYTGPLLKGRKHTALILESDSQDQEP